MPASKILLDSGDAALAAAPLLDDDPSTVVAAYEVYGVSVAVRATSPRHWSQVLAALPLYTTSQLIARPNLEYAIVWGAEDSPSALGPVHSLHRHGERIYRTHDADTLIHALQVDVVRAIATTSVDHTFVHAGAVVHAGTGILLPGVSGAGKSTLVRSLLDRGAQYYSDEYAVLDRAGMLCSFPCRLRLGITRESKRPYAYQELGAIAGDGPASIGCVVFPTYSPDAPFTVEEMKRSSAALHLLEHMPLARAQPKDALTAAVRAVGTAHCYRVRYSDCSKVADFLYSTVGSSTSPRHDERREGTTT